MMMLWLMLASPPPLPLPVPPVENAARRVIEWQLKAQPRSDAGLSAEEAARVRQLYLESIGRRVERVADEP
ncbi:hypothetical protein CAF53_16420 [Sphingobium sp. LB126]|uniref:hypothetical protein n=1 Tax=Sphingobium sp. LB126 TaxID=1983755 RepID=UPI000C20D27A|nr:hypothetical protein [Sphingobium sp. LB126]PJG45844.1 hypothetical protein CAF53_16420 [Sphingobium sp. LB126]